MLLRHIPLIAILILPHVAQAQFSLVATQLGYRDEADGASYEGICSRDACRATLPIRMFGIRCVLNIRVSAPTKAGSGGVLFAAGPCEGGYRLDLGPRNSFSAKYEVDSFGAVSKTYDVPIGSSADTSLDNGMDDGVVHPLVRVRLDVIATRRH
jgi:hypothetical protein